MKTGKRNMDRIFQEIKDLFEDFWYAWEERKTPYLDNEALKARYLERRSLYHEKMNRALVHQKSNNPIQAFGELSSAVDSLDTANLWEKKARLAKNINDNRDNVPLTLFGTLTGYLTSMGVAISIILTIYTKGFDTIYDSFFWGLFIAASFFGIIGRYNQNRLKRLVEEHRDYTREYEETAKLIEKKKDLRIR